MTSGRSTGYLELLKSQPSFRNLWYGQVISELGDWLNSIAIYTLILQLSGSGMAMAAADRCIRPRRLRLACRTAGIVPLRS